MYKIVIPIFIAISGFGVLANAIVVFALRATKIRNAIVTLILSLTVSDIWYLIKLFLRLTTIKELFIVNKR